MHRVYVNRPDHFFFYNVKMTADFCNFPFETVLVDEETANSKDFKAKKGFRKFPFMETPDGQLVGESTAIAAYIARVAGNQQFLGETPFEAGQVDQWVAFATSTITPAFYPMALHIFGHREDKAAHDNGVKAIKEAVKVLNGQLGDRAWIVGDRLTLADIVTFNALLVPYTFVLDGGFRKAMPKAAEWFLKMSKLPVVTRTAGYVKWVGAGQDAPAGGAAKGGKQQQDGGKKGGKKGGKQEQAKPKAAAKPAEDEIDEDDLFGDGGDDGADAAAAAEALKKKGQEAAGKKKKAAPIAKSLIVWEVKPWGEETDLQVLADKIIAIEMDGLMWKTEWKKEPVAYGIFKIVIGATVEDDKVSTDTVAERIEAFEDEVQSVDILAFNKL
jgi:glutathione S-transferase/translation elongation factor EF-1beta